MKLEGIVSQDGKNVVTEATGLQIIYFIHTKLDGSKHTGFEVRALPNGETLGEYVSMSGAELAKNKIISKIRSMKSRAFVLMPEDKEALRLERECYYT